MKNWKAFLTTASIAKATGIFQGSGLAFLPGADRCFRKAARGYSGKEFKLSTI
ncbi:hypothetical protein [Domibacillus iocasae]|uniref:hypothetical protein n=1 Tax=Domibacillus iocasae TaxID=1714016 RepID=UPI000AF5B4BB|nr:hypothetical protein [Domibacillus iocasae]